MKELFAFYQGNVRPFLEAESSRNVAVLDSIAHQLERSSHRDSRATVCFLGNCAVGKSTLLNAVIGSGVQILPSGGIGPMTALATTVQYGEYRRFRVRYQKKAALWRIGFALEAKISRRNKKDGDATGQLAVGGVEQDDVQSQLGFDQQQEESTGVSPIDGLALQIVTGSQFRRDDSLTEEYLADAVRIACDMPPKWGTVLTEEDMRRIKTIASKINVRDGEQQEYVCKEDGDCRAFLEDIEAHTVGYLAPIIDRFDIEWPSDLLKSGVVLVDLPGVGVAGDRYRQITHKFVKELADAVVLVVDRAGMPEASLSLLRASGYWDRLVGSVDNLEDNGCSLLLAVTHVDDLVGPEMEKFKHLPKEQRPKRFEVYGQRAVALRQNIATQARHQISTFAAAENESILKAQRDAIRYILDRLQVHPVCAPEYSRLQSPDEDDPPFLKSEEQTGIPTFRQRLVDVAASHRRRIDANTRQLCERLRKGVLDELNAVKTKHSPETIGAAITEALRRDLDFFVEGRQKELENRKGAFGGYLRDTSRELIGAYVAEAKAEAQLSVRRYLRKMQGYHWGTLRAAVRRGGTWVGGTSHNVCVPEDIADLFQEPVAGVWSVKLLGPLRKRTQEYADDVAKIVREVHAWAEEHADLRPSRAALSKQSEQIDNLAQQMKEIGKDAVTDLRQTVKNELYNTIEPPIEAACKAFVKRGTDIGPGVKSRILELFDSLAENATVEAEKPARSILTAKFRVVEKDILAAFDRMGQDPLAEAREIILRRHEKATEKGLKEHKRIIDECDALLDELGAATALGDEPPAVPGES